MRDYKIVKKALPERILEGRSIEDIVGDFAELCKPFEDQLYLHVDAMTNAIYCECHIRADSLLKFATIDVPLDPDEQPEYRANRDIVEDHVAFEQMKSDAINRRTFSNIVTEFDQSDDSESPLKIIGGQHRYVAIKEAYEAEVNGLHGLKVYFGLDKRQRLDVQLISNLNIAASTDLYDRLQETARGPELRNWCQEVGFLDPGQDFSAERKRGSSFTVREIRSFILNFYLGKRVDQGDFENIDTTPVICKTGKQDPEWDQLRENSNIWDDKSLQEAAREFILLDEAQRLAVEKRKRQLSPKYAEKALNLAILTAWSFVAGMLQQNKVRLKKHYDIRNVKDNKDPLNAEAMAKARHKSDPENYRGLGTRNDAKERGRCVEVFYLQAEKGSGITPNILDVAIKRYHKKQANIELLEAEEKIQSV